jgi:hypothetical protein
VLLELAEPLLLITAEEQVEATQRYRAFPQLVVVVAVERIQVP